MVKLSQTTGTGPQTPPPSTIGWNEHQVTALAIILANKNRAMWGIHIYIYVYIYIWFKSTGRSSYVSRSGTPWVLQLIQPNPAKKTNSSRWTNQTKLDRLSMSRNVWSQSWNTCLKESECNHSPGTQLMWLRMTAELGKYVISSSSIITSLSLSLWGSQ